MTDSFGARLRRERERRQIALASIAASTKIKRSLFEELERDDVSHWPSGIFRRSFIRAYAEAIGLPADPVVREFVERFPDPMQPSAARPAVDLRPPPPEGFRLKLDESAMPVPKPIVPTATPTRTGSWLAIAWDAGVLVVIASIGFIWLDQLWMPLALGALVYCLGGTVALGQTPGMRLWAHAPVVEAGAGTSVTAMLRSRFRVKDRRVRERRVRQVEPGPVNPFKTSRRRRQAAS